MYSPRRWPCDGLRRFTVEKAGLPESGGEHSTQDGLWNGIVGLSLGAVSCSAPPRHPHHPSLSMRVKKGRRGKADNEQCGIKHTHTPTVGRWNIIPQETLGKGLTRRLQGYLTWWVRSLLGIFPSTDWGRPAFSGFRESLRLRDTEATGSWKFLSGSWGARMMSQMVWSPHYHCTKNMALYSITWKSSSYVSSPSVV